MTDNLPDKPNSEILIYQAADGRRRIDVRLQDETVWLTQKLISELFQKDVRTINEHIKNIYEEGDLEPQATIRKFRIVQTEGTRHVHRLVDFYNLDMILAVGYRVRSPRAVQFRQWATARLSEYLVKGSTLDDERPNGGGWRLKPRPRAGIWTTWRTPPRCSNPSARSSLPRQRRRRKAVARKAASAGRARGAHHDRRGDA
jgi:hypothetical protein